MNAPAVVFLGAAPYLVPSIGALRRAGYRVTTVDRDPAAPGHAAADARVVASVDDVAALCAAVHSSGAQAIVPGLEAGVFAAAAASAACNLAGIGIDVARACTVKTLMRAAWGAAGLRQPDYVSVVRPDELHASIAAFGLPLVLKPAASGGSQGVSVIQRPREIQPAIDDAVAVAGHDGFIVERYIRGPLLTCDGFVLDDRVEIAILGDVETEATSRARVNTALNYPAAYPAAILDEARILITAAVRALRLRTSAFHCECIVSEEGVYLVELAARGGGSYIASRIVEAHGGLSGAVIFARLLLGERPALTPSPSGGATLRFLQLPRGVLRAVHGLETARRRPGILDIGLLLSPGDRVRALTHDNARHGFVVAQGGSRAEAIARATAALADLHVTVEPSQDALSSRFINSG